MKTQPLILWAALLPGLLAARPTQAAPKSGGEVTIISTGDRQTPGYRVTVTAGGALASTLTPRGHHAPIRRSDTLIAANRERFFADLAKAEPVSRLSTGAITSAGPRGVRGRNGRRGFRQQQAPGGASRQAPSAYPEVFVRYQGRQSPNLRQASSEPGRVLYQDVKQILQVLRLPIPNVP